MSSSQYNRAFVNHFESCKSRIKHEMRLKVDDMVDGAYDQTLQPHFAFDQSRLTAPRVLTSSGPSHFALSHHNQLDTFIPLNSTHLNNIFFDPTLSHLYQQYNRPISFDPFSTGKFSPLSPVPPPPVPTNAQITLSNELTNAEPDPMPTQHEIEATEPMETVQSQHQPPPSSRSSSNVNEQSNDNLNNEEICECDECQNGIEIDQVDDDDDDSVQWIDNEDKPPSLPLKKQQQDTTQSNSEQSNVTRMSVIISTFNQTYELQPTEMSNHNPKEGSFQSTTSQPPPPPHNSSTHNKQIITLSRQCHNCPRTFAKDKLQQHMLDEHSIGPFRCLVKDCTQSFDCTIYLGEHIKNIHHDITQWQCDKCLKHFPTYILLSNHNSKYHQVGHFQCAFPQCTFTSDRRIKVHNHYSRKHKRTQLHCEYCDYQTHDSSNLKRHRLTHSSIKPYRCKWQKCHSAFTRLHSTIGHIERMHFATNPSSSLNIAPLRTPKDYVEVLSYIHPGNGHSKRPNWRC